MARGNSLVGSTKTLADYLGHDDPLAVLLWPDLVQTVFHEGPRPRTAHPEQLSAAARVIYYVGCFDGELVNGGMSQFFSNSSGNHAHETLQALRAIGAALSSSLLEKALTIFPNAIAPIDRQLRCDLLFAFEKRNPKFLEDLTDEYYNRVVPFRPKTDEDLMALELAFMQQHQAERVAG